jgi:hypothetical protein
VICVLGIPVDDTPAALCDLKENRCYGPDVDVDRLAPGLRRAVEAADSLDDRVLMLLFVRKGEPVNELVEILASDRGETMAALGRLTHARLVSHGRSDEGAINWFATANGRARGEQLLRAAAARPSATTAPEPTADLPGTDLPADSPAHQQVRTRRRVPIDQNEKTGFSWD